MYSNKTWHFLQNTLIEQSITSTHNPSGHILKIQISEGPLHISFNVFRCSENQRKCSSLAHQTELQKESNEEKRLTIQKEKEINEGKHLAVEQEKEKRKTLQLQQQHEEREAEKRRLHEIEIESKKSEIAIVERKVAAEKELKKFEIEQSMHNKSELQKEQHKHDTQMQDKCNEERNLQLKIQEQRNEEKRLELEIQEKRNEEKSLELKCLQMRLQLKEESGDFST